MVSIQRSICEFNWKRAFDNNDRGPTLNNATNYVLSNFIPHEKFSSDGKNPTLFDNEIENIVLYLLQKYWQIRYN